MDVADATLVVHETTVDAEPDVVFGLVEHVEQGPRFFASHLHAEVRPDGRVDRWVVEGGSVRGWSVRRTVDRDAGLIVFEHAEPAPPLVAMRGEWRFAPAPAGGTSVRLEHSFQAAPGTGAAVLTGIRARLDRNVAAQLAQVSEVAERHAVLSAHVFQAAGTVLIGRPPQALYETLRAGALGWSVAPVPPSRLAVKWTGTPDPRLRAVTAVLDLAPAAGGAVDGVPAATELTARATVTIDPERGRARGVGRWLDARLRDRLAAIADQAARTQ